MRPRTHARHLWWRPGVVTVAAAVSLAALSACGSGTTATTSSNSAPGSTASSGTSVVANATLVPPTVCGEDATFKQPAASQQLISTFPTYVQNALANYSYVVQSTPWSTFKGKKGPWKIGYISVPITNPWQANIIPQLQKDVATLKKQGLVSSLDTYVQPSSSTSTPEQQSAVIAQMVRQGIDAIILFPADSVAETPAIDAAGKAGVPVISVAPAPNSKYAINMSGNNNELAYAGILKLLSEKGKLGPGKTLNTLMIRGLTGQTQEQTFNDEFVADMKPCQGINIVGTVWGQWSPATTKTQVLSFLSSHPGVNIDFVAQQGSMQAGVIQAFEEVGKTVPEMDWAGTSGGDLYWWNQHKSTYYTVGGYFGGAQVGYTALNIATRILSGKEPISNTFQIPPYDITSGNVGQYAAPATSLNWVGDPASPVNGWINNTNLDYYFKNPGAVMGDS